MKLRRTAQAVCSNTLARVVCGNSTPAKRVTLPKRVRGTGNCGRAAVVRLRTIAAHFEPHCLSGVVATCAASACVSRACRTPSNVRARLGKRRGCVAAVVHAQFVWQALLPPTQVLPLHH
jgi:hypothetical protein